jgi:ABC-type proline/glycine betaine transport system permease subunit
MVGQSPAMQHLRQQLRKVAVTDAPVLLGGESGSGKELAARAVHKGSRRADQPFVAVNCAAIAPTLIQSELFGHERGAFTGATTTKPGLIEAAQAMGCQRWHIVRHVLLPEALPGIVGGFTITLVALISSSAMAGAVGAGGLGDLAIRYGYQRFDTQVMVLVIAILIALVTLVQFSGDRLVHWLRSR